MILLKVVGFDDFDKMLLDVDMVKEDKLCMEDRREG